MESESIGERARLIVTASMLLDVLSGVRSRQPRTADVQIVERWIARVAGVRANLDAVTEWQAAEAYTVNDHHPGDALRRLFPAGLEDADFEGDLRRLEEELSRDDRDRVRETTPAMSADDSLADLLTSHASARFHFLDVRSVAAWRRERLPGAINIPFDRLANDASKVFRRETRLVVFGEDDDSTQAAADVLAASGFERPLTIPRGFAWFEQQGWETELGP